MGAYFFAHKERTVLNLYQLKYAQTLQKSLDALNCDFLQRDGWSFKINLFISLTRLCKENKEKYLKIWKIRKKIRKTSIDFHALLDDSGDWNIIQMFYHHTNLIQVYWIVPKWHCTL